MSRNTVTKTGQVATVLSAKIELSGPFFQNDPAKTFLENVGDMLESLSAELQEGVRKDIASREPSMPYWTGYTEDHVFGYTTSARTGRHWAFWAAVGIPTTGMDKAQAIRTKAAAATIERRFHPFRNAKSAVYRARAVISADLAKGLT